jgi:hypothetical protein
LQREGHGTPFACPGAHGKALGLEPAPFCGNLVVAFWEVWKGEVARGVRVRCSDRDTPNRHMNACQGGLGLIDHGADDCGRRLSRSGTGHPWKQQDRDEQ